MLSLAQPAIAQDYPNRPVRLLVGFAPGGGTDVVARIPGVPGYTMSSWYGVFAPAGTPAAIVGRLHADVNRAMDLPEVRAQMLELGTDGARTASPQAFAEMFRSEYARYAKLVKETGIKIE